MEIALPIVGFALIVAALLQFAFWTGRLVRLGQMERRRFDSGLLLLKAQLDEIAARRKSNSHSGVLPVESNSKIEQVYSVTAKDRATADGKNWNGYRNFRIVKLVKETANATSVYLQPVEAFPLPDYKPGQHLTVRLKVPGSERPVVRCYTLSDAPDQDYYRLTIKRAFAPATAPDALPGVVSSHFNDQIAEGDVVEVKSPSGRFWLAPGDSPIVLLAGGIGITPMMSMIQHLANIQSRRQCLLLYGVRSGSDLTFGERLNKLSQTHANIHVINCFSMPLETDQPNGDYQVRGFVSIELLRKVLPSRDFDFYLCGPPPFMKSLYNGLIDWGVPDSRIQFEAFGPATINCRSQSRKVAVNDSRERTHEESGSTVKLTSSGHELEWSNPDLTLLDLCEANGISIDSGCRAGNCGTCETRLISGSVCYEADADCAVGYFLPCIARPNGPIEIDA